LKKSSVASVPDSTEPRVASKQGERSERSRQLILDAALELFSHRGYGATSVQDIAEKANVSKGNVYHHFSDKETIFRNLLDTYFQMLSNPDLPFNRALASGTFPENLEALGQGARAMVTDYRQYIALIYVDVVEFEAAHVRKFYEEMASRFERFLEAHDMEEPLRERLVEGLSPTSAVILATRIFLNYFTVEVLFGVRDHFGHGTDAAIHEISRILRHGMLKRESSPSAKRSSRRVAADSDLQRR